jgi:hypothetical protein
MRILLFLFLLFTVACQPTVQKMEIFLLKQKKIQVPAVSGLEVYGDKLLMISDNTEGISICDFSGNVLQTISLEKDESPTRIFEKKHKADYEACSIITKDNSDFFLLIGSGSKKENRSKAKLISLNEGFKIKNFDLEEFYTFLRSECNIEMSDFNIEALAYFDRKLYFFNRATNEIFVLKMTSFFDFLKDEKDEVKFKRYRMEIDPIEGVFAGVSGATITPDGIVIITTSAEGTADWYNDGEITGSSIGCFHLSELQSTFKVETKILKDNDNILKSKIESVTVNSVDQHKALLFLVSDNDGADSELFEVEILFD